MVSIWNVTRFDLLIVTNMITGWFMVDIFNYSAFRILGRISYSAFMCHLFFLKLLMAGINQPIYLSFYSIVIRYKCSFKSSILFNFPLLLQSSYVIAAYALSNLFGLILTLSIELPMTSILKVMFRKSEMEDESIEKVSLNFFEIYFDLLNYF